MKHAMIAVGGIALFVAGMAAAGLGRKAPEPSPRPTPAPPRAAAPAETPPAPVPDGESERLKAELESLRRQIAELEGEKKVQDAQDAEAKDPATRGYAGMKLMDDALKEKLGLSADQELRMRDAILAFLKAQQEVWKRTDLTFEQKEQEIERLRLALEPDFQSILSGAQYAQMSAARGEKKAAARASAIQSESSGYRQFLGLDATQSSQLEGIVRGWYDSNPSQKTGYKWMYDEGVRSSIRSILSSQDQIDRFDKNMAGLDASKARTR